MAILILAVFILAIALELTGHVVFRGRLILLRGGRWLVAWWSLAPVFPARWAAADKRITETADFRVPAERGQGDDDGGAAGTPTGWHE